MQIKETTKILYIITKGNFGGAQRYVLELAHAMKDKGITVMVASGGSEAKGGTKESSVLFKKLNEIAIESKHIASFSRDLGILREFQAFSKLRSLIREFRPDIVHLNSSKAGVLGTLAAWSLSTRPQIVFTAHGWPFLEKRNAIWRIIAWIGSFVTACLADRIIVVSKNDERYTPWLSAHKVHVIHPSLPTFELAPRDTARKKLFDESCINTHLNDFWLVSVAELNQNKNIIAVLKALATFNGTSLTRNIFYTIIGSGEDESLLKSFVSSHGLSERVVFLGHIDEARAYLKAFDALILPSRKEGFPYALLEAGYASLPTIASKTGGVPEIIDTHVHGILVDPEAQAIAIALQDIVEHHEVAIEMGHRLQAKVTNLYTLETMMHKTNALYEGMISRAT